MKKPDILRHFKKVAMISVSIEVMNADNADKQERTELQNTEFLILYMEFFRFSFLMKYEFNKLESIKQYST